MNSLRRNLTVIAVTISALASLAPIARAQAPVAADDTNNLAKHPLKLEQTADRAALEQRVRAEMTADAAQVTADPSAAFFPGSVPASAERVTKTVTLDTTVPDWHSTGLYAAPGDKITVTIPGTATDARLGVRIGAHRDQLWKLPVWKRAPEITRTFPLTKTETLASNAFGGLIYVVVPQNCALGTISVAINGAVAAPYFVKGVTSLADWKALIRNNPAPWAEVQGERVIITVPSSSVRNLDDPQALATYWDQVADAAADLYAIPHERKRQERYCCDEQISAGYMHSGYPIMTWMDVAKTFTDLSILRGTQGKTWGFYHELGHNHQKRDWTWNGMGEVTNNLFSLYGNEKFNGVTSDYLNAHNSIAPAARKTQVVNYLAKGVTPDGETSNPWLALTMFIDLREAFGWDAFTSVFREYNTLTADEHPKTETDKHDQFMVRFSKVVGKNLGPYFTAWGLTTSDAAKQSIAALPSWMPADWPTSTEIAAAKAAPPKLNNAGY